MDPFIELIDALGELPLEYLTIVVALAGIGLAAFAIHAVFSTAKNRDRR